MPRPSHSKAHLHLLKEPFKIFPEAKVGGTYGPMGPQKDVIEIPHKHPLDVVLVFGGARGGKSVIACAAGLQYLLRFPGSEIIIGAENMPLINRTIKEEYRKRLTITSDWDHPLVARHGYPTVQKQKLQLINGSKAHFIHFNDYEILRGMEAVFAQIEEASIIGDSRPLQELIRRMSGKQAAQRQIIITTNPEESKGWLYDTFSLKQFEPGYDGPRLPIGKPCTCQFCQKCLNIMDAPQEILFESDRCPRCGFPKEGDCPGNQEYFRVVFINPHDNPHLPSDYIQSVKAGMDERTFQLYTEGKIIELREGKAYNSFSRKSIYRNRKDLDYEKDLIWSFDFNVSYQCSVVIQEWEDETGTLHSDVIDEIVLPDAGMIDVAEEFLNRYGTFPKTIWLDGDPAQFNNDSGDKSEATKLQKIYNRLTSAPHNLKVKFLLRKIPGKTKISVIPRVDSVNEVFRLGKLFINPHCSYLIRSLEELKWRPALGTQTTSLDTQCDKNAAKHSDKTITHLLSHPTDALGYYIYKRYPIVEKAPRPLAAYLPGGGIITSTRDGEVIEFSLDQEEQDNIDRKLKKNDSNLAKSYVDIEATENTIYSELLDMGGFATEDEHSYFQDSFLTGRYNNNW
jgi:Phage terminase large subunit